MNSNAESTTDLLPPETKKEAAATLFDIACILVPVIFFCIDFVLDVKLAVEYYQEGHVMFFILTIFLMALPALILTAINIWWYEKTDFKLLSKLQKLRGVFICLMMAPLLKRLEALYSGIKSFRSKNEDKTHFYDQMIKCTARAALLTLLEVVMECGPQIILQLYIFTQFQASNPYVFTHTEKWQMFTIFASLCAMSFAYACYQRASNSGSVTLSKMAFLFVWRFFEVTARVTALGLFAAVFPYSLMLFTFVHSLVMFCWLHSLESVFFENKFRNFIYKLVLAVGYIFFFFKEEKKKDEPKEDEQTRRCFILYYTVAFFENTALVCLWYFYYSPNIERLPGVIIVTSTFTVAAVLMIVYLYKVHPSLKIRGPTTVEEPSDGQPEEQLEELLAGSRPQPREIHYRFHAEVTVTLRNN